MKILEWIAAPFIRLGGGTSRQLTQDEITDLLASQIRRASPARRAKMRATVGRMWPHLSPAEIDQIWAEAARRARRP